MKKKLLIRLFCPYGVSDKDLKLRYILADTIEERNIGDVLDEGTGENYTEIKVHLKQEDIEEEINSILLSLGVVFQMSFFE